MTALTSLGLFILTMPLAWELWNDRNGDLDKGRDVIIRCLLFIVCALVVHYLTGHKLIVTFNLAGAIHWLLFDYLINIILYRNGVIASPAWFQYLGKSSKVDKIPIWKSIGPYGRLFVKLGYFLISIWLYFKF